MKLAYSITRSGLPSFSTCACRLATGSRSPYVGVRSEAAESSRSGAQQGPSSHSALEVLGRRDGTYRKEGQGVVQRVNSRMNAERERREKASKERQLSDDGTFRQWRERRNGGGRYQGEEPRPAEPPLTSWAPTKKLTYAAMAGMRALHQSDPKIYNRAALGEKFGISYDAVGRILRSRFEHKAQEGDVSPVPAIQKVIAQKRQKYNST